MEDYTNQNIQLVMPTCRNCKKQLLPIVHEAHSPRGMIIGLFCCAQCGEVYNILPLGMQEPKVITLGRN